MKLNSFQIGLDGLNFKDDQVAYGVQRLLISGFRESEA
jgi:hypothetical protein